MYALSTLLSLLVATTLPPSSGAAGRLPSSAVFRVARGGASKSTSEKVAQAMERAAFEQEIEDYNAFQRGEGSLHRRMVCLPLTDNFDPPPGQQGHGKLQVSDRVSVPKEFAMGVLARKPEPPWQFELRKVSQAELDGEDEDDEEEEEYKRPSVHDDDEEAAEKAGEGESEEGGEEGGEGEGKPKKRSRPPTLEKLYCHVLDWQAPRNYVFVPKWMMKTLRLKPRDVVELTWVRLKEGAQITLRPRTKDFDNWANPQAVMESELKYYSALTVGSTIKIDYKDAHHAMEVVAVQNGEEQLDGGNIQDVNVAVDFTGVKKKKGKGKKKD